MIPKLIRLGVDTILKVICEKITIRDILIINKNNKFNGIIEEINIKAETIIYNKIHISNINIIIRDLLLSYPFNNKKFIIDNCQAVITMRLTRDNINKTLSNNKWRKLKTSIETFISKSFQGIEITNKSIYFIQSDKLSNKNVDYTLHHDESRISLVNNINQEKLLLLNDKNICIKNLFFCEKYIELELTAEIIFN
tara:strand:+ start:252 stop:839 length:588 start_codon:yes stop_codon:yes gene_type:complete